MKGSKDGTKLSGKIRRRLGMPQRCMVCVQSLLFFRLPRSVGQKPKFPLLDGRSRIAGKLKNDVQTSKHTKKDLVAALKPVSEVESCFSMLVRLSVQLLTFPSLLLLPLRKGNGERNLLQGGDGRKAIAAYLTFTERTSPSFFAWFVFMAHLDAILAQNTARADWWHFDASNFVSLSTRLWLWLTGQ